MIIDLRAAMIPLLPPLVEFMDPKSLCHYSGTSKTLRKDVRDTKAWELLAKAQLPRKTRDVASEALSQVKSHVRRRLLADALSHRGRRGPPTAFRRNRIEEFTFFVRFEEEGRKIWEGDLNSLKSEPDSYSVWFDLGPVGWTFMDENGVKITIVAIRDEDDAMVSLGQFTGCDSIVYSDDGLPEVDEVEYGFKSRTALYSSAVGDSGHFNLRLCATLVKVYETEGYGSVKTLELRLEHYSELAVVNRDSINPDGHVGTYRKFQLEYLLSYLAGIHHLARAAALLAIETSHVESFRHLIEGLELR